MNSPELKKRDDAGIPPVIQQRYINNMRESGESVNNPILIAFNNGICNIVVLTGNKSLLYLVFLAISSLLTKEKGFSDSFSPLCL